MSIKQLHDVLQRINDNYITVTRYILLNSKPNHRYLQQTIVYGSMQYQYFLLFIVCNAATFPQKLTTTTATVFTTMQITAMIVYIRWPQCPAHHKTDLAGEHSQDPDKVPQYSLTTDLTIYIQHGKSLSHAWNQTDYLKIQKSFRNDSKHTLNTEKGRKETCT